ncbi:MAG TPA: TIGR03982 family His-Xaa-Ser system protein [Devosia sp.]|jgi:succinate dehydrogenase flavin-adding protein (antitoxin of CptAB toxin-antitoxin module)|uniref:TIGR03982 family His-Xaa-Ser system protein n=1 Tax=Devosia sp. TaxID=1871048 RepID=UPI002DDCBE30|nr:TIGR03982 family His-Xaa-Ser system protein [Devosia sp.]HEV2515164.1 TIGR03982 family His-Xaa-Ser system protein [Devosia sp.]
MRWALSLNRGLLAAALIGIGVVVGQLVPPLWKTAVVAVAQLGYAKVTYACDRAMREHMLAKFKLAELPSEDAVDALKSAELGLLDCQDYDILRKQLLMWGLTENELSLMMLNAIETDAKTLQQVVEAHEIRF